MGEFKKSEALALVYLNTAENKASAFMNLYFIYTALSESDKAKEAFNNAIRLEPEAFWSSYEDSILKFSNEQSGLTQDEIALLSKAFD